MVQLLHPHQGHAHFDESGLLLWKCNHFPRIHFSVNCTFRSSVYILWNSFDLRCEVLHCQLQYLHYTDYIYHIVFFSGECLHSTIFMGAKIHATLQWLSIEVTFIQKDLQVLHCDPCTKVSIYSRKRAQNVFAKQHLFICAIRKFKG